MKKAGRLIAVISLLSAVGLSACAGRVNGVLVPTLVSEPGASNVSMFVATTRQPSDPADGLLFTGERGPSIHFAEIGVSIPPNHQPGQIEWPARMPANPATEFVTTDVRIVDRTEARKDFRRRIAESASRNVLVFVHGYNNTFGDAVYRGAQIVHDSGADVVPVLFTWPSRASTFAYPYDRESANFSRDALEELLFALAADPGVAEVSVLAHSMGNWVTMEALRQMAIRRGSIPSKISNVMLAAPDVDIDVARTQMRSMGTNPPRFTLFVSQNDRALAASRLFWGSSARLGSIDANEEPFRTALSEAGITVVDLTATEASDPLNHATFAQSPEVVRLIGARLATGQEIGSSAKDSLAGSLTNVVASSAAAAGTAAGLLITAPIAVIDPSSREYVGEKSGDILFPILKPAGAPPPTDVGSVEIPQ